MAYRLLMLGPPTLLRDTDAVVLKSRKGQALLWYLAAQPTVTFPREHLHGMLWDDIPADAARRNFNTMLSRLRSELPTDCLRGFRGHLGWNPESGIRVDIVDFLHETERYEAAHRAATTPAVESAVRKEALHRAVALWRGPFLEGFSCDSASYEEWILAERQRWELRMLAAMTTLVNAEKADGRWPEVIASARRALDIDPLQETFHRAIMEALLQQGNRSAALTQFELCRRTLEEQLGAEPDAMTMALFQTIKASPVLKASPASTPEPRRRVVPDHIQGITTSMPPLIGRQREYRRIVDALVRTADRNENHVVLLRGEAGIGKTRLLSEIVDDAAADTITEARFSTVLVGRAYESMLGAPYAAFVDALDAVVPAVDWRSLPLPDVWLGELGRLLPDVLAHRPDLHPPPPGDSGDDRVRLFQAVSKFLGVLPQPVLLALDDLQWADPLTGSLMAYLLRRPPSRLSLAVLATARTGEESDSLRLTVNTLKREARLTNVELANLTEDDTVALISTLFPGGGRERAARVYSQSLGHPLYTVELMSMLADADIGPGSSPLPVPPTVQDVFFGRLLRLGEAAMDVAEALALFRRGAAVDELRRVTDRSEAYVAQALDALIVAHIAVGDSNGTLTFRHDVFRRAVLERMSSARLIHLHRRAYAVLADAFADVSPDVLPSAGDGTGPAPEATDRQLLADLVAHSVAGRMWDEALERTRQAAVAAERLYAFPSAVEYLNTALTCLDKLPATDARRRQRLDVELHIAKLDSWSAPDLRDARLAAAARRAQTYGAAAHLPRIRLAQADSLILQGRCEEASALLDELSPLAARDPRLALGLQAWRGAVAALVGDVRSALNHFQRVQEAMGRQVLKPGTSVNAALATCHAAAGDFVQAEAALAAMEREEKEQGYQSLTSKYLIVAATVACLRERWTEARQFARQGLITARAAEDSANEALSALWLGVALLESAPGVGGPTPGADDKSTGPGADGRSTDPGADPVEEAVDVLKGALAASERAQTYTRRDFIYAFLALAYARAGRSKEADGALHEGFRLAARFGYKEGRALCTEIRGRIAALRGDKLAAAGHFRQAVDQFQALGNVVGADRCRTHTLLLKESHPIPPSPPTPA